MMSATNDDPETGYEKGEAVTETNETPADPPLTSFFDDESVSLRGGCDLSWSGVNLALKSSKGDTKKQILQDVWGVAKAGETTAIMGASGAGKTSLFSILSGRLKSGGNLHVEGDICWGGHKIDPAHDLSIRTMFAFVAQEESLHESSTPRESLHFSAKLRLPKDTNDNDIDVLVDTYIKELDLVSCADSRIGSSLKKGISGGEKRRTTIGVELISKPSIVFLDEPTSGLDSFAAKQVMKLLEKVAAAGDTVLFTIHQPSSSVFSSFDRVLLLNKGRMMYQGHTNETTKDFAKLCHVVPENYNPADWIVEVAQSNSIKELGAAGFFPEDSRDEVAKPGDFEKPHLAQRPTFWTQLMMLMKREKISLIRSPAPMVINVVSTTFLSIIFGVIFFDVGRGDRANSLVVQAQLGAVVNILISTMMGQSQTALVIFSSERSLFLREYSTNHYSIVTYFLSHLMTEALQALSAVLVQVWALGFLEKLSINCLVPYLPVRSTVKQALIVYWMIGFQMYFLEFLAITYCLSMTSTAVSVLLGAMVSDIKSASALFTLVVVPQFYFSGVFIATNLIPIWVRYVLRKDTIRG